MLALFTDNARVYVSKRSAHELGFANELELRGIEHKIIVAYKPHQKRPPETRNRSLMELVGSMVNHSKLYKLFLAEALNAPVYVRNRVTTTNLLSSSTPFELWIGRKPDFSNLRAFKNNVWYKIVDRKLNELKEGP